MMTTVHGITHSAGAAGPWAPQWPSVLPSCHTRPFLWPLVTCFKGLKIAAGNQGWVSPPGLPTMPHSSPPHCHGGSVRHRDLLTRQPTGLIRGCGGALTRVQCPANPTSISAAAGPQRLTHAQPSGGFLHPVGFHSISRELRPAAAPVPPRRAGRQELPSRPYRQTFYIR